MAMSSTATLTAPTITTTRIDLTGHHDARPAYEQPRPQIPAMVILLLRSTPIISRPEYGRAT
jgi:hypothetical protein